MDTTARTFAEMTAAEFLATDQAKFGDGWRYELDEGVIVAHAGPAPEHGAILSMLDVAIENRLRARGRGGCRFESGSGAAPGKQQQPNINEEKSRRSKSQMPRIPQAHGLLASCVLSLPKACSKVVTDMTNSIDSDSPLGIKEISILEDSRYFVNRSTEALNLQVQRLKKNTPGNTDELWKYLADVHFYIVVLKRLRQAMLVSRKIHKVWDKIQSEFDAFDNNIADILRMRNTLEHIDEYIQNRGRDRNIKNASLYAIHFDENGCLNWAGLKFDSHNLQDSAARIVTIYREITSQEFNLYRNALNDVRASGAPEESRPCDGQRE
jgi:hypothetical protein